MATYHFEISKNNNHLEQMSHKKGDTKITGSHISKIKIGNDSPVIAVYSGNVTISQEQKSCLMSYTYHTYLGDIDKITACDLTLSWIDAMIGAKLPSHHLFIPKTFLIDIELYINFVQLTGLNPFLIPELDHHIIEPQYASFNKQNNTIMENIFSSNIYCKNLFDYMTSIHSNNPTRPLLHSHGLEQNKIYYCSQCNFKKLSNCGQFYPSLFLVRIYQDLSKVMMMPYFDQSIDYDYIFESSIHNNKNSLEDFTFDKYVFNYNMSLTNSLSVFKCQIKDNVDFNFSQVTVSPDTIPENYYKSNILTLEKNNKKSSCPRKRLECKEKSQNERQTKRYKKLCGDARNDSIQPISTILSYNLMDCSD